MTTKYAVSVPEAAIAPVKPTDEAFVFEEKFFEEEQAYKVAKTKNNPEAEDLANGTDKTGKNATKTKVTPSREAAAEADKTKRVFDMKKKPNKKPSQETLDNQAKPQTECVEAEPDYEFFKGELGCDFTKDKQYKCENIAYCHTIDPDNAVAGGNPKMGGAKPVWDTAGATTLKQANGAIRKPEDAQTYNCGDKYNKGDLVNFCGKSYECINPKSCSAGRKDKKACVKPGKKAAGVWQKPVTGKGETKLDTVPESAQLKIETWKRGAKTYNYAYTVGAIAFNKKKKGDTSKPKPYECNPETITGKKLRPKQLLTKSIKNKKNVAKNYKLVRGCIKYAPGSKGGAKFWVDVGEDVEVADIMPEIEAATFEKDGDYGKNDFTVAGGDIYVCIDDNFCKQDPTSKYGEKGWEKTAYETKGIPNFKAEDKPKPKINEGAWSDKQMYGKNAISRPDKSKDEFFKCVDEKKCRKNAPNKAKKDGSETGWALEEKAEEITKMKSGKVRPVKDVKLQEVIATKFDKTKKDYAENTIVGAGEADDSNAYQCMEATCGTELTEEKGWLRLNKKASIKTEAELKAATVDCMDFSVDVPYRADDLVTIDKAVFKCNPKRADECGQQEPTETDGDADGEVWIPDTTKIGKSIGLPKSEEVDAIPAELIYENADKMTMKKDDYTQFDGVVFKCAKTDGTCTTLLKEVGDEIKKQEKADTKGENDIDYMGIIKTKLLDTKAFEQSFNKAKKSEEEYGSPEDLKDENKAASKDFAFMCDASEKAQEKLFTKGQTFCDPKTGEAFTCEDELKCNEKASDPQANDATAKGKDAFKAVWKKVDEEKTKGKMFVTKQDRTPKDDKGAIKKTKAYDWTKTTSDDFTGTYKFKPNELAKDGERLYKCAGKEEDCAKTQPSKDKEGKVWKITTLPAEEWTQAEIDSQQSKQKSCFDYEEGYAFLLNDSVCDPDYPTKGLWTCLDAAECSNNRPNLKKVKELQKVWALTMEKFYMKDGEKKVSNTIIKRDTTNKPQEGAPVQCKDFEDFESGNDSKDATIGSQLYWCEKGRVYKCNEKEKEIDSKTEKDDKGQPKKIKVRETCSNGCQPSSDNSGAWSMVRQRGSVQKLSKDEINKRFGEERQTQSCMPDSTFKQTHASWDKKEVTSGTVKLTNGVACSEDKDTQRKAWSSMIQARGKLPENYLEWPKNAKVIDQTFRCGKQLDAVLAGIKFNYAKAKPELLNIMSWFPSICGEAPEGSTRDIKQICREEFAGIVTFALSGEMHEEQLKDAKGNVVKKDGVDVMVTKNGPKDFDKVKTDQSMEWWQTAFSKSADRTCFKAESESAAKAKTAKCENLQAGYTGKGAVEQDSNKFYYDRGAGPLPLKGPQEYNEFSKAMTGKEDTFGKNPEKVMTEGNIIGEFEGRQISGMPIAVALWRYTQYYHSYLPSMHDVIVGMWKPRDHEKAAGLEEGKFCSVVSLVVAMSALRAAPGKGWAPVKAKLINQTSFIADGTLGEAYRNIYRAFGIRIADQGTKEGEYDYACSKTKNWPEPDAKDTKSRQMIFLKPNTSTGKCEFTAEKSAYNAFQEGDVKRCFMDSTTADKDKTMSTRRASIADDRQACKLWDIKSQVMFEKNDIACVPLDKTKCDDKCLADPKTKKHMIFKCLKAKDCMQTSPLDKNNATTKIWEEDKSKVADNNTTDPGLKYKVERAPIGAKEVDCIDFKVMTAEEKTRFKTKMTPYDKNSADPAIKDPKKTMLYVCSKGRAFKCIKQDMGKLDIEGCFAGGEKGPADDTKGNWEMLPMTKGKVQPKFEDKYPDCLVPKGMRDSEQDAITKAGGGGKTANDATNKEMEKNMDMSKPVQMLIPDEKDPSKYNTASLDGIFTDKYGGLCTNMKEQTSYEVNAFINSVVDSQFTYVKDRSMDKDGYKNVKNAPKASPFTDMPNVMNAKTHLTEDMFKSLTGSQAKADFLKYYDFLNAVSMAPMFCGAEGAGYYKDLPASAMCKKELAAFFATGISMTNEGDKAKTVETKDNKGVVTPAKGYDKQGFKYNEKSECAAANVGKRTAADKTACEKKVSDTEKTGAFTMSGLCKATCSATKEYYPRGPGQMQGAQEYFWFNKIAMGNDKTVVGDPDKLVADGRTYFMSGIFKWMVPFSGRPSPHAIITGQWTPSKEEMQASIPKGYGAIINLVDGKNLCGKYARYPKARQMVEVWVAMKKLFKLEAVTVTENGRSETFNTMKADEKDDCEGSEAADFPKGLFGKFPIYFVKSYKDAAGKVVGAKSGKCFATPTPSEYVVYEKDAYRNCAFANKA